MISKILERPSVYLAWQAPFVGQKLGPYRRHNREIPRVRVLELGCGPGTNAALFSESDYVGIDLSRSYVEYALALFPNARFLSADVSSPTWVGQVPPVDQVFMNSLLHHLSDSEIFAVFSNIRSVLKPGGKIHIIDLVLPARRGIPLALARLDRGAYARPLQRWRELLEQEFETGILEPFSLTALRIPLWDMFYWSGTLKK